MTVPVERRRTARITVGPNQTIQMELRHRVQMVDISQSGALFVCDVRLPVGVRGQLRTGLADTAFATGVLIRRHHERPESDRRAGLGTSFTTMDEKSRHSLEKFLRRASE